MNASQQRKQILIVEDDPKIAMTLQIRFKAQGYDVVCVHDAVTGLAMASRLVPDLVILDVMLPGGNGLDIGERLQNMPETRNTPFLLITASRDPRLRERAMSLRAVSLLEKPYDPEELLALAQYAMGETGHVRKWNPNTPAAAPDDAPECPRTPTLKHHYEKDPAR